MSIEQGSSESFPAIEGNSQEGMSPKEWYESLSNEQKELVIDRGVITTGGI